MGHLELFTSLTDGRGIFLRYQIRDEQSDPTSRQNYSIVLFPEKIEVDLVEIDNNIETIPSLMSMVIDSMVSAMPALHRLETKRLAIAKSCGDESLSPAQYELPLPFTTRPGYVKESDWFCQKCGLKNENLWLNLSDGSILCGRKFREGTVFTSDDEIKPSEGHGHAYSNYRESGHPLVVQLSSISPYGAKLYSFSQDEFVHDEHLSHLLERLGIMTLKAGMEQLPIFQQDESSRHEVKIHLDDSKRAIVHESGLIGIGQSTGTNSALITSVQMVCRSSSLRIFSTLLPTTFRNSAQPLADFNVQFGKLVAGLMEEDPVTWTSSGRSALNLSMIVNTLGCEIANLERTHSPVDLVDELLRLIERKMVPTPIDKFKGVIDTIVTCVMSGGCSISDSPLFIMRTTVAPHLMKAIEDWADRTLENFYSPKLQERAPGVQKRRFQTFPSKLLIAPNRIFRNADWVMEEYGEAMAVEDELDLSWMASDADLYQSNMDLGDVNAVPITGQVKLLCEMGFSQALARKALDRTSWDVEAAAEWCIVHCEEDVVDDQSHNTNDDHPQTIPDTFIVPDYDEAESGKNDTIEFQKVKLETVRRTFTEEEFESRRREYEDFVPDEDSIMQLEFLGIGHALAKKALRICRGDIERSADWAFNNWDSPTDDEDINGVDEAALMTKAQNVQGQISDLQREGEEILKQMEKEKGNPSTDFVAEMVQKMEGRQSHTARPLTVSSSKPRAVRQKSSKKDSSKNVQNKNEPSGSPTTQALRDLMADLGASPLTFRSPQFSIPFQPTPPQHCPSLIQPIPSLISLTDDSDFNPVSEVSTCNDILVNENNCMIDTTDYASTDYATTDYDTDFIVTDNLTSLDYQTDMTENDNSVELEGLDEPGDDLCDDLLNEMQPIPLNNHSVIDQLINESVHQIDKQIEMNVAASSIENLKMATTIESLEQERFEGIRVSDQGIPDLSVISEERSRIPTDFCTSPEGSFKSDCEPESISLKIRIFHLIRQYSVLGMLCSMDPLDF